MPWEQSVTDLNHTLVLEEHQYIPLADASTTVSFPGPVSVYFRNAMSSLVDKISQADVVYSCAAWMTHKGVLNALGKCKGVSIVVAKEDWMQPDSMDPRLKKLYSKLVPLGYDAHKIPHSDIKYLNQCQGDVGDDPVRCCGNYNQEKVVAWPRMHHKFLVFARYHKGDDGEDKTWIEPPKATHPTNTHQHPPKSPKSPSHTPPRNQATGANPSQPPHPQSPNSRTRQ
ncbi:hypothetical protein HK102_006803, partial [Quaeritorhiza haematococci]